MGLVYFDDIFMVYILFMDIFYLNFIGMINCGGYLRLLRLFISLFVSFVFIEFILWGRLFFISL